MAQHTCLLEWCAKPYPDFHVRGKPFPVLVQKLQSLEEQSSCYESFKESCLGSSACHACMLLEPPSAACGAPSIPLPWCVSRTCL